MKDNPWIGVAVLVVGVAAAIAFAHYHVPEGMIPSTIVTLAAALLMGQRQHETRVELKNTQKELDVLRDSVRPKSSPDLDRFAASLKFPPEPPTAKGKRKP